MKIIGILLLLWNMLVFLVYGTDKLLAIKKARRIRESSLLLLAFLFGSIGAVLGMLIFNHKTSKMKFRLCVPLSFVCSLAAALIFLYINIK